MQGSVALPYAAESPNDWLFDHLASESSEQNRKTPRTLGRFAVLRTHVRATLSEVKQYATLRSAAIALGCVAGVAALINPSHDSSETLPPSTVISEQEMSNRTLDITEAALREVNAALHYTATGIDLLYHDGNEMGAAIQFNVCPPPSSRRDRLAPPTSAEMAPRLQKFLQAHLQDVPFTLQSVCLPSPPTFAEANPKIYPCLQTGAARKQWRSLCLQQTKTKGKPSQT